MAKLKETIMQTHKIDIAGILDADTEDMYVEVDGIPQRLFDLFKKMNGQDVSIAITNKIELSIGETEEIEPIE